MTLRLEDSGHLLVGTGNPGPGVPRRSRRQGVPRLDTPYQEVRAINVGANGLVYAAALNGRPSGGGADPTGAPRADTRAHTECVHGDHVVRHHRRAGDP
jgi:hypothetical protein